MPDRRPRRGDWIQSFTNRAVYPLDPRPEALCVEDIAHSLALVNRFGGHTPEPYSVGDHSLRVEEYVATVFFQRHPGTTVEHLRLARLAALMHDAPEAFLGDMVRPLKHDPSMVAYRNAEDRFARAVEGWLGLPIGALDWSIVKEGDNVVLATEKRDLRPNPPQACGDAKAHPLPDTIVPRGWREAELDFLARFRELTEGHRPETGPLPHYHHCPWCYERKPCTSDCTIEGDLSDDGVSCGAHNVCDDCAQLAPPDRPVSALDEDLPLAVRLDLDPDSPPEDACG